MPTARSATMPLRATHGQSQTISEVYMSKTAITSPQRLRDAHKASVPVESVTWDGERFAATCTACRIGPCTKSGRTSSEALGRLACRAYMRDVAAQRGETD